MAITDHEGGRILGLDGLRALAIVPVLAIHTAYQSGFAPMEHPLLEPFVRMGWAGVDLFFAISGFLITTLLLREERAHGVISLPRFYARRALRILPAFVFTVLLCFFVVGGHVTSAPHPQALLTQAPTLLPFVLTFTSNYAFVYGWLPFAVGGVYVVLWSLCVEEHFYALWPSFLRWVRPLRSRVIACCTVAVGCLAARALEMAGTTIGARLKFATHLRFDALLWGALAAILFASVAERALARRAIGAIAALVVVAFVLAGQMYERDTSLAAFTLGYSALAIACAALVAEVAATPGSVVVRVLELRSLRAIGEVSYGMYLLNVAVIDAVVLARTALDARLPANIAAGAPSVSALAVSAPDSASAVLRYLVTLVAVVAATYVAAWLMNRLLERPFLRWKARLREPVATRVPPVP